MYQKMISEIKALQGNIDIDSRHIEAYMRVQYSTLDHLSPTLFEKEVHICSECVKESNYAESEKLAISFGL